MFAQFNDDVLTLLNANGWDVVNNRSATKLVGNVVLYVDASGGWVADDDTLRKWGSEATVEEAIELAQDNATFWKMEAV